MTKLREVPERVSLGSDGQISSMAAYFETYSHALSNLDAFWLSIAHSRILWRKEPSIGLIGSFSEISNSPLSWFQDGELNVTETCLDGNLQSRSSKNAIIWEGDEPGENRKITYEELHREVCQASNALLELGVSKGDRVIIYMGMVPEAAISMLACARIGAIHSVVFGGFSSESLRDRVLDCESKVVITQDEGMRGGKKISLKDVCDEALSEHNPVESVIVFRRTGGVVGWDDSRDIWWDEIVSKQSVECSAVICNSEDPLFILYTSGSTGKPKGLVHTCGGYISYVSYTHATVFDLREDDIYACVADVGWITGHSYIVYGPLANGATTMMFESIPTYPDAGRYWDLVERFGISVFYTAPTAIRALAAQGDKFVRAYDRSSLRVLGTVGEPINPDAWNWYYDVVGEGQCNIVDTWWQTETGGICISPIANVTPTTGGSATLPLPGILPVLRDSEGGEIIGEGDGLLYISEPWPGQARTIWGDHQRFSSTYFSESDGLYFTGDGCRRDSDGYHWITGRVDDVINVSGHRMGTAEFESLLVGHSSVAEASVVGFPHPIKGTGVYSYVVLQPEKVWTQDIESELNLLCRKQIGSHAKVDLFQNVPGLPKTRSGKVMRRILRKVAEGEPDSLGDISTLADPSVVKAIIVGARSL
jgi:acetyl-CoA synthetase